jgi:hypothetical protein
MGLFETDAERKQREHNEGQEAGSKASWLDRVIFAQVPIGSDEWREGFKNGAENPKKDDD